MSPRPRAAASKAKGRAASAPLRKFAPVFAALGDETRLLIVAALCSGGGLSIAQLTSGTELTRQAVTKHLQVLADAGLVNDTRVGRERLWAFESSRLDAARRSLDALAEQWDRALDRLKLAVER